MTKRIAVVDMGSNTLKFSVTEVAGDGSQRLVDAQADTVRLCFRLGETGQIDPERALRALAALRVYEQRARGLGAESFVGVATEAMRSAANGPQVMRDIGAQTAWQVEVVTGEQEAQLAYDGLRDQLPRVGFGSIADIGGASTEIIAVVDGERIGFVSIPLGSGVLADRAFSAFPPGVNAVESAVADAAEVLASAGLPPVMPGGWLVLSGGSGLFLEAFGQWSEVSIPFFPDAFGSLLQRLAETDPSTLARVLDIAEERAQVLPAGGAIAMALIDRLQPETLLAAPSGLRAAIVARWHRQQTA